jgi:hypothetical protein
LQSDTAWNQMKCLKTLFMAELLLTNTKTPWSLLSPPKWLKNDLPYWYSMLIFVCSFLID